MYLNEHGMKVKILYRQQRRVKTLYVPHLQASTRFAGQLNDMPSLVHGGGQWLLYKNVFSFFDGFFAPVGMVIGGGGNIDHIALFNQVFSTVKTI